MSVDQQHLLKVFELWDGIVTVPHCLATLLSHDALTVMVVRSHGKIYIMVIFQPVMYGFENLVFSHVTKHIHPSVQFFLNFTLSQHLEKLINAV